MSTKSPTAILFAQHNTKFKYFPEGIEYNTSIPKPAEILGYEVGEWHATHDQLVYFMKEMARISDRITIKETGRTYENRPLLLLTITHPDNHQKIEEIRKQHIVLSDPELSDNFDISNMPSVVLLDHGVHGNEASASNSAILTVYHWAAAQGEEIDDILKNTIILVDPCLNPDGFQRFSGWINANKGNIPSGDPMDREHNEAWPRSRTNHYWFDLNRDWLPAQHPESQTRLVNYHAWKPNIVTDHHEMGGNSSFFFMPGIPSRNHPLIPQKSIELVGEIAEFHARELDKIGTYYFTEETFDNFYFGKGSTYPDIHAAIGILFEQGSVRGHVQNTINGKLTFPEAIRNQFTVAYSSVLAAQELRLELLEHQSSFYKTALAEAANDPIKGYIWNAGPDHSKTKLFIDLLNRHKVDVYKLAKDHKGFKAEDSYIVPADQKNYRMVKVIFEKRTQFQDSLFYDISAWSMPLAMNLNHHELRTKKLDRSLIGESINEYIIPKPEIEFSDYAYAMKWDDFHAPKALNTMLTHGLRVKVATSSFQTDKEQYERGSLLIQVNNQEKTAKEVYELLKRIGAYSNIQIDAIHEGNTSGVRLGSGSFRPLRDPKVAILTDGSVSSYDAGEIWHLLDHRMEMQTTLLPVHRFGRADLSKYNTLILPNGRYNELDLDKLKNWIKDGGLIIATRSAGEWLAQKKITNVEYFSPKRDHKTDQLAYADQRRLYSAQVIGGAIFNTKAELTHPLLYGVNTDELAVFRRGSKYMKPSKSPFANPLIYTENPLLAGYISKENLKELGGTAALTVVGLFIFGSYSGVGSSL